MCITELKDSLSKNKHTWTTSYKTLKLKLSLKCGISVTVELV